MTTDEADADAGHFEQWAKELQPQGPITAFRLWTIDAGTGLLSGPPSMPGKANGTLWQPSTVMKATCLKTVAWAVQQFRYGGGALPHPQGEPIPSTNCTCGLHGTKSLKALYSTGEGKFVVVGTIRGWGKFAEHENGWRFEYAAVDSILTEAPGPWKEDRHLGAVAERYQVPLVRYEEAS